MYIIEFLNNNRQVYEIRTLTVVTHCFFYYCYYSRKNLVYESNKPLLLPAGCDSFDKIDDNTNGAGSIRSMHKYKNVFASNFKQVKTIAMDMAIYY